MNTRIRMIALLALVALGATVVSAQSRPRRAKTTTTTTNTDSSTKTKDDGSLLDVVPTDKDGQPATTRNRTAPANTNRAATNTAGSRPAATTSDKPILTSKPSPNTDTAPAKPSGPDLDHAIALFNQKQFAEALKEARAVIGADATNSDAWKLAGLSELSLKQYPGAVTDLEKARDLQKAANLPENKPTIDGLAEAYARTEQYDKALPLLTAATTRTGETPDPILLQLRGVAEIKGGKTDQAALTFAAASKANPKDTISLFYLGKIAFDKKDFSGAIANFNRVTVATPSDAAAWKYLVYAYLQRAQAAGGDQAKADADYLGATRASDGLVKANPNEDSQTLRGLTLFYAKQYPQSIVALEKVSGSPSVTGDTLLVLGQAYLQTKNNLKMISALEKASVKSPSNVNVLRLLGYGYEVEKQYGKALAVYQKAAQLAPDDATLKESVERVKPFAK